MIEFIHVKESELTAGLDTTNIQRVRHELLDIIAVAEMIADENMIAQIQPDRSNSDYQHIVRKREKVERYLLYSEDRGRLDE